MPSTLSHSMPKKSKSASLAIVLENNQPIPPQRTTRTTRNYSEQLQKLKKGQCYRVKDHDLYLRMCASAYTRKSKRGTAYVCRWIGTFGRIWNPASRATKLAKR